MSSPKVYSGVTYSSPAVGTTNFALTSDTGNAIEYLSQDHIKVESSPDGDDWTTLVITTDYTFNSNGTEIILVVPTVEDQQIRIDRFTPLSAQYITFSDGSLLTSNQLNKAEQFSLYCDQEIVDGNVDFNPGDIGLDSTDGLPEGSVNLYYSDARVEAYVSGAGYLRDAGVTKIIAGPNVGISPTSGTGEVTITASGGGDGGGIPEAPLDGGIYGRQSAAWTSVTIPDDPVQSDWSVTDSTDQAFIKNKPGWTQSDWNVTDASDFAFIKNKPTVTTPTLQQVCTEGTVTDTKIQAAGFRVDQLTTLP